MTTKKEKLLQKINPKLLKLTPKLSGNAGSFIDLDSDDSLVSGAKELMIRFFKNQDLCEKNKRLSGKNESEFIISTPKYNDKNEISELITERLTFKNNDEDFDCEKPGRRLQKLKMELQEKISAKWEEEYRRRVSGSQSNKQKYVDDDEEEEEEIKDSSQKTPNKEDSEDSDDGDEADNEFDDDEDNIEAGSPEINENKPDDNLEKDDDYENCSLIPAYQPGGGMLYGGSELTQGDDGLPQNLLSPSLRLSNYELSGSKTSEFPSTNETTPKKADDSEVLFPTKTKLFSQNPNDSYDLADAFDLCSGKFPDAEDKTVGVESQNSVKSNVDDDDDGDDNDDVVDVNDDNDDDEGNDDDDDDSDEDENEENKAEQSEVESKGRKFQNIIVFDDSDEENEGKDKEEEEDTKEPEEEQQLESQSAPLKILSDDEEETSEKPKTKKTRKNLNFSDDEDTLDDKKDEESDEEEEKEDDEDDDDKDEERSVHYDSEENEINPREFFEKEAELSGSEWSGDEDERGLDEFDVEEGDADCLDQDQVRSQLEKIHIRRVLDDDAREVRLIQEILFEDGDLHSDEKRRDRKFKWKNLGAFDEDNEGDAKEENENESEDDGGGEEEELRKLRHERELFLMTKQNNGELSSDDEIVGDFQSVKVTTVKSSITGENKMANLKSVTEIAKATSITNARGSFLSRNEEFLSRLAKVSSAATDNVLGPKNSKNFVFATKSPEKEDSDRNVINKRQIEDSEPCNRREKKIKLLPPEIDTGPSIVDLLV